MNPARVVLTVVFSLVFSLATAAEPAKPSSRLFQPMDVFELEWAVDPQVSPDGRLVAYVRKHGDVMKDAFRGDIWTVGTDGTNHRPVVSNAASPRWSPDGTRLAYVAADEYGAQIFVRWMDSGVVAQVTRLRSGPSSVTWSPTMSSER